MLKMFKKRFLEGKLRPMTRLEMTATGLQFVGWSILAIYFVNTSSIWVFVGAMSAGWGYILWGIIYHPSELKVANKN